MNFGGEHNNSTTVCKLYFKDALIKKKRLTDLENKLMVIGGKGQLKTLERSVPTAIFKMDNQQKPVVQHIELCYVPSWM